MKYSVNDKVVLSKKPEGPLESNISKFSDFIDDQGYSASYTHRHVLLASCFSRWLRQLGVKREHINSNHPCRYLRYRARQVQPCSGDSAALDHLMNFLRIEKIIPAEKISVPRLSSVQRYTQAYEQYLRATRGLAEATILSYVPFISTFLENRFGTGQIRLSRLTANDVVGFVQRQAPRLHRKRSKQLTCALRSYLKYVRYSGKVTLDLAAAVPVVPNWSMPSIPRAISADQVHQLLSGINRVTAIGRRDYAILLLLARLGLRSGEVAFLELDNIDWSSGTVSVRGKGGQRNTFPLPVEVGKAIAAYLQDGRQECTSRRLFLRAKAPVRGFQGASGVGSIVRHSLKRCGVNAPTFGAHQFRHGLATDMLRHGASLSEIGDVLGHHNPQTTKIYTKVDVEALQTLAIAWPGGVR